MPYQTPDSIAKVLRDIDFKSVLAADDPRLVDTKVARGSEALFRRLGSKLGLVGSEFVPATTKHILLFGHTGVGKSTELRRFGASLKGNGHLYPIEVDVLTLLDKNNLQYADTLLAMAQVMLQAVQREGLTVPADALAPLEEWFTDKAFEAATLKEFQAEVASAVTTRSGLPWLLEAIGKFTASAKFNSTHKETIRTQVRRHFSQLAAAFNKLVESVEAELTARRNKDVRVLFVVDGTDKLSHEDTKRFFVQDANQLVDMQVLAIYTAPISLKYQGFLHPSLDADLVLPMIKLFDQDGARVESGWDCLKQLLLHRADRSLFSSDDVITKLIEMSGGHPRELLRLLKYACEVAASEVVDASAATEAIGLLAAEYRWTLGPDDFALLARIDSGMEQDGNNDESVRRLLLLSVLLQYNDGSWRRSHPVVRTLPGYKRARAQAAPLTGD